MKNEKAAQRASVLSIRNQLSKHRHYQASQAAFSTLQKLLHPYSTIASFVAMPGELDLSRLNEWLLLNKTLVLPKRAGSSLQWFQVHNLHHLVGQHCKEPDPCTSTPIPYDHLDCILVPGVSFDPHHYRLGYGKGFYDRTLQSHPIPLCLGVCFKEQLVAKVITEPHDRKVSHVLSF